MKHTIYHKGIWQIGFVEVDSQALGCKVDKITVWNNKTGISHWPTLSIEGYRALWDYPEIVPDYIHKITTRILRNTSKRYVRP